MYYVYKIIYKLFCFRQITFCLSEISFTLTLMYDKYFKFHLKKCWSTELFKTISEESQAKQPVDTSGESHSVCTG